MTVSEMLETAMLLCFSASWYWSIREVWIAGAGRGMPFLFPVLAFVGCLLGLGAKLFILAETGAVSHLIWLYAWNVIVTAAQLGLMARLAGDGDGGRFPGTLRQHHAG